MDIKIIEKLAEIIKDALDVKAYKTFDLYEQFVIGDLIKRGYTFKEAVELAVNSVEGDESQLSEGIKSYSKDRKGPKQ